MRATRKLLCEIPHQQRNVFGTLAQGRNSDGNHIQAVVEVASKLFFIYHFLQVAIGCGHQTDINFLRLRAAKAFEFPLLQGAQKFWLNFQRNVSHLVQKQRALICQLKPSGLLHNRAGESAPLMAKQFALEQTRGNRRTVELYQGPILAAAAIMDSASDQFLSGASLSQQQYGRIACSHGFDQLQYLPESRTLPNDSCKVGLAANLIFQVELFLRELVLQVFDFAIGQGILNGDRHLSRRSHQELNIFRVECILIPPAKRQNSKRTVAADQGQTAARRDVLSKSYAMYWRTHPIGLGYCRRLSGPESFAQARTFDWQQRILP